MMKCTYQVRRAVWEGDHSPLLHEVVAQVVGVHRARPEGQWLGAVHILTLPLQVPDHGHQAGALLRQTHQVQPQRVRGVEDLLDAANQVVDVLEQEVLPAVTAAHHGGAGGEVGEGSDSFPSLRILPVHSHCYLDTGEFLVKYSMQELRFYCKINENQVYWAKISWAPLREY